MLNDILIVLEMLSNKKGAGKLDMQECWVSDDNEKEEEEGIFQGFSKVARRNFFNELSSVNEFW